MLWYIVKRILYVIPVMLGVLIIVFALKSIMPGDPVDMILPTTATAEEREAKREELGLNDPIIVQFVDYVKGIVTELDFGTSYKTGQPVSEELMQRFPITFILALGSVLLGTLLAIPLGILSAVKQYTWIDSLILVISMLAVSIPSFWLALMFLSLFSVELGWLPSIYDASLASWIMPVIVIALSAMSGLTRITRSSMLEVIRSDYIRMAQAKGQTEEKIITRHALRNAMIPILAAVGNSLGTQLGGALVIETIFGMPGIGKYITDAISQRNFPAVQGGVILLAFVFTFVNLVVDLSYTFVDPRLKGTIVTGTKRKKKAAAA
ncbi:peptide/nickel transport system permease protein [Catenibacillus scindens]|uniref:Peptide/nickel transport system permease protein n=1 Tax=Catenibacillus scindens TaxID=673271 RepID=A0A7W8HA57_9FIRM|nr:ABC transporter permease [Catenibacillus scindens]MBB5264632.1 peptide/nickel transport system permease protein [Catenibacillus scindens]